jgi:3-mercaptopyruvate sulfurtransferase SseA
MISSREKYLHLQACARQLKELGTSLERRTSPWATAANEDGTFKSTNALKDIYGGEGVTAASEVISYCRIGERSARTWFLLKYLLGHENVRNYDGSWTEWGNLVEAPIERTFVATVSGS